MNISFFPVGDKHNVINVFAIVLLCLCPKDNDYVLLFIILLILKPYGLFPFECF